MIYYQGKTFMVEWYRAPGRAPIMKGLLNQKMEDPGYRAKFEHRRRFFLLEEQILLAMEDHDWSFEDLAKETGIHRQNIWRDLRNGGLHKASLERVARYAEALGLHAHHFLLSPRQELEVLPRLEKVLAHVCGQMHRTVKPGTSVKTFPCTISPMENA